MRRKPIYLVVTPFFPSPERWQGAYVLDQVKAIARTGRYRVVVYVPCGALSRKEPYDYDGVEVSYVPSFFMPSYFFNGFGGGWNGWQLMRELHRRHIDLADVAVVHCHTASFACYASAIKRKCPWVRTVLQYHDPDPYQVRNGRLAMWKPNAVYRARKLMGQFCNIDLHLCISKKVEYNLTHFPEPHVRECFESYRDILHVLRDVPAPGGLSTYVLYNGVDTSQFHRIEGLRDASVFKIGCVANFIDWKDQMTLIRAVEALVADGRHESLRVSFVGSGGTKQSCQDYIEVRGLGRYFVFEKEVHHRDLVKYYNSLDLFVLPSYFEGFGCVFTEAAACGVPFMGCVNQGYSEYIPEEEKNKWLIEPGNFVQLAKNIEAYMKFGYPQKLCKSYDIDELIQGYLSYIAKL